MQDERRNDKDVQVAAQMLFAGVVPERRADLEALWQQYNPRFNLLLDKTPDGLFVMEGGLYRDVIFNHRALRAFWLASFITWEGYQAIHNAVTADKHDLKRFDDMIEAFGRILAADDPLSVPLPPGVPEPGIYPDPKTDIAARVAAELATFAVGWAFLHEIRHLKHQQDGTSAGPDASSEMLHMEELSCDEYATKFMLETVAKYASDHAVDVEQVRQKREIGIYFALFAMTLIGAGLWDGSESHPAMQERIDTVIRHMNADTPRVSDAIAHAAFGALWMRWPAAPGPFKRGCSI